MKPTITVAENIFRLRKDAHMTQDDLASFLGVTKASVSKWETGQSYPDIELLPRIATFFGKSIDELVGYEPQMTRDCIRRECSQLREAFATEPFEEALARCRDLARDYYSCYPLLTQIALVYLNHIELASENDRSLIADEGIGLCRRVRRNSEIAADVKQAETAEASFLLVTGNPQAAIDLLAAEPDVDNGSDILLANAYSALGQIDEANTVLQGALLQSTILGLNRLAQLGMLNAADAGKLDAARSRSLALVDAFNLEEVYVNVGAVHLSFAMAYSMAGNADAAIECLESYERSCRSMKFPVELHGDEFFDKAQDWIDRAAASGTSAPRDEAVIKRSLLESVTSNPAFAPLAEDPRFKRIVKSLEAIVR